jgi:hypothetical protein
MVERDGCMGEVCRKNSLITLYAEPDNTLGAPLARLEAEIAINTLLRRIPDLHLRVAADALRWRPSMFLRGLKSLPVSFSVVVD